MAGIEEPMEVGDNPNSDGESGHKKKDESGIEDPEGRIVLIKEDDESPISIDIEDPEGRVVLIKEVVDLTHCRLRMIPETVHKLIKVEVLSLRQNIISELTPLCELTTLTELDVYDNEIKTIHGLESLTGLTSLDLSFNHIRVIEGLSTLCNVKELFLINNKITKMEALSCLTNLTMLELGSNRLRVIEGLDCLINLEKLFLGKNKITKIQNLDKLVNLRLLSLQSNRLTVIEGLETLMNLEELYLSDNGITDIQGLGNQKMNSFLRKLGVDTFFCNFVHKLNTLDLAVNRITRLKNLSHLTVLEDFWFNNNTLEEWHDIEQLAAITSLRTVYFEHNPIARDSQYRRKLKLTIPSLTQIDATLIR